MTHDSARAQTPFAHRLRSFFWNPAEGRLRAGWRLLAQLLIAAVLVGVVTVPWGFLAEALAAAPVWSSLPLRLVTQIVGVNLVSVCILLSLAVAGRFIDHRPFKAFGFALDRRWWLDFGFGAALGAVLMALIFAVQLALGWVEVTGVYQTNSTSFLAGVLLYVGLFISVSIQEETMTRGYWLRNIAEGLNSPRLGPRLALLLSYALTSSIFGLLHLGNPNSSLVSTLNLVLAGLLLGLPFVLTGELAIPLGLHLTWNFFQGNVFGFPVSGGAPGTTFIAIEQGGPEIWTGGAFGPEAGLIGVIAMLLGAGLIVAWTKLTRGRVAWHTPIAEYTPPAQAGPERASLPPQERGSS